MPWAPQKLPEINDVDALRQAFEQELERLAAWLGDIDAVELRPVARAPDKPRDGMIVFADGTNFNPGGTGRGVYTYSAGGWVKL